MRNALVYLSIKYNGDWDEIYKAISRKESIDLNEVENQVAKLEENFFTILDDDYPVCFKNINKPPFVIFYKGNINLLFSNRKKIAIIGSRNFTSYGKMCCEQLLKDFDKSIITISGLARGIDTIAHRESIKNNLNTIAVLGNGLNMYYPKENEAFQKSLYKDNLVLSEYPTNVESSKYHFPVRNRIISAISEKIVVVEAKKRSGTMITVNFALEMGKDIYCFPQKFGIESGCNLLINQGAKLITSSEDLLKDGF